MIKNLRVNNKGIKKIKKAALATLLTIALATGLTGCANKLESEYAQSIAEYGISGTVDNYSSKSDLAIVTIENGNYDSKLIEKALSKKQTVSLIVKSNAEIYADAWKDIDTVKEVVESYNIDGPIYLDLNSIIDPSNKENTLLCAHEIIDTLEENKIYVGVSATNSMYEYVEGQFDNQEKCLKLSSDDKDSDITVDNYASIIVDGSDYYTKYDYKDLTIDLNDSSNFIDNTVYEVTSDTTVDDVAKKYGISSNNLRLYNNLESNELTEGQVIMIPSSVDEIKEETKVPEVITAEEVNISAEAAILMDAQTGKIIYSKNSDKAMNPASITKVLTALVVLENGSLDDIVEYTENTKASVPIDSSTAGINSGAKLTVRQALYALMLASDNESGVVLARYISGSEEEFVELMNKKAKELGCTNSHFLNPHGYSIVNHYITANDMGLIMKAALDNGDLRAIMSRLHYTIESDTLTDGKIDLTNHAKMLNPDYPDRYYDKAECAKTGYTKEAGHTFVCSASEDGHEYIVVVLNAPEMYKDSRILFEQVLSKSPINKVEEPEEIEETKKVEDNKQVVAIQNINDRELVDTDKYYRGIDVSTWQGDLDWEALSQKIDFAIIRIGDAYCKDSEGNYELDDEFVRNITECNRLGIPVGCYYYSRAKSDEENMAEIRFVLNAVEPYNITLPIYRDVEGDYASSLTASDLQEKFTVDFCSTVEAAGYPSGVYLHKKYLDRVPNIMDKYSIWAQGGIWYDQTDSFDEMHYSYEGDDSYTPFNITYGVNIFQPTESGVVYDNDGNVLMSGDIDYVSKDFVDALIIKYDKDGSAKVLEKRN